MRCHFQYNALCKFIYIYKCYSKIYLFFSFSSATFLCNAKGLQFLPAVSIISHFQSVPHSPRFCAALKSSSPPGVSLLPIPSLLLLDVASIVSVTKYSIVAQGLIYFFFIVLVFWVIIYILQVSFVHTERSEVSFLNAVFRSIDFSPYGRRPSVHIRYSLKLIKHL